MNILEWNKQNIINRSKPINQCYSTYDFIESEFFTDENEIYTQYDLFDDFMKSTLEDYTIIGIAKSYRLTPAHYSDYYLKWVLIVKSDIATFYMIFEDQNSNINKSISHHKCHTHCGPFGYCEDPPEKRNHEHYFKIVQFSFHQLKTITIISTIERSIIIQLLAILANQSLIHKCISPV